MDYTIEVEDLRRIYRVQIGLLRRKTREIVALDSISFHVHRGEIFGLIGPNGAGKTTTIKILTTLLLPTAGTARVLGVDVTRDVPSLRRRIGLMFGGERGLYWRLSAIDNLRYFADLYGIDPQHVRRLIPDVLELVGLAGRGDEKVQGYSRGMKQRLHIARMLLPDPDVLFLDEPTDGMDPIGAKQTRELLRELQHLGKTILVTTHNMNEVDELCDRVAILDHGHVVALDTPATLKGQLNERRIVEIEILSSRDSAQRALAHFPYTHTLQIAADGRTVVTVRSSRGLADLPHLLDFFRDMPTGGIRMREPTLQDVYERFVRGPE